MTKRYPEEIQHLPKSFQIMIFIFVKRLDSGKNCLVAIVGATGSGKSLSGVTILYWTYVYMYGKPPTLDYMKEHWFFTGKNFLKKMNDPKLKLKEGNLWDEMGTSASHKTHQSLQNRAIGWLVQTFRNLQQLVIFTVPTLAFVDASVRKLLHYQLEARTILKSEKICIIKPLILQYNIRMDKTFYHNFMYPSSDEPGMMDEVDVIGIPLPPPEFVKAYEELSFKFKSDFNIKLQGLLERAEQKDNFENLRVEERALAQCKPIQLQIWGLLKDGITSTNEIAKELREIPTHISRHFGWMRNKGLDIDKYTRKTQLTTLTKQKTPDTI